VDTRKCTGSRKTKGRKCKARRRQARGPKTCARLEKTWGEREGEAKTRIETQRATRRLAAEMAREKRVKKPRWTRVAIESKRDVGGARRKAGHEKLRPYMDVKRGQHERVATGKANGKKKTQVEEPICGEGTDAGCSQSTWRKCELVTTGGSAAAGGAPCGMEETMGEGGATR